MGRVGVGRPVTCAGDPQKLQGREAAVPGAGAGWTLVQRSRDRRASPAVGRDPAATG